MGWSAQLAATLSCAMIFLGVKAIEYSHKWEMGLLPAGLYFYDPANPHPESHTNYLFYICLPFMILLGESSCMANCFPRDKEHLSFEMCNAAVSGSSMFLCWNWPWNGFREWWFGARV